MLSVESGLTQISQTPDYCFLVTRTHSYERESTNRLNPYTSSLKPYPEYCSIANRIHSRGGGHKHFAKDLYFEKKFLCNQPLSCVMIFVKRTLFSQNCTVLKYVKNKLLGSDSRSLNHTSQLSHTASDFLLSADHPSAGSSVCRDTHVHEKTY